jgi:hypothetical protein
MTRLSLTAYKDSTKAVQIADWSTLAQDVIFETDEHGFANLTAFIPMSLEEAFRIYNGLQFAHVVLSDGAFTAFEGRLEDSRIIGNDRESGIEIRAFGYQNALRDLDYICFWSRQDNYQDYYQVTSDDTGAANREPEGYIFNTDGRLNIALRANGHTYANQSDIGSLHITILSNSENDLNGAAIDFDYTVKLPTNWEFRTKTLAGMSTSGTVEDTITGDGTTLTGTKGLNGSTSGAYNIEFQLRNNTGSADTVTEDSGVWYAKVENLRVRTAPSGTVSTTALYADEVARGLVTFVSGINSTQLSSSTALIETQSSDITDLNIQGRKPADVLNDLVELGDGATPPGQLEWGVWEGQKLHLRTLGDQGQDWYIDVSAIQIDGTVDTLANSTQASYKDTRGRWRVTAVSDDSASQSKYGVVRRSVVNTPLKLSIRDTTAAEEYRDVHLTSSGAIVNNWQVRAGDTMTIRNLPAGSGGVVDKIRTFRISRTRCYVSEGGRLEVTPGLETPSLEFMVAANAARGN